MPIIPTQRQKRPYESLGPTQRWERRVRGRTALEQIGVPRSALKERATVTAAAVAHLPTNVRKMMRGVRDLHIPSEPLIARCKKLLATTHATKTATFSFGAFVTDPVRLVTLLTASSEVLVVGGDAGGGLTKLGVTFLRSRLSRSQADRVPSQEFVALIVYEGKDTYANLEDLRQEGLTPFEGDSAAFPHIFAVLQHFIDTRRAFLNGDWPFINTLLGQKNASAIHPCPICIVSDSNLLGTARYRTRSDRQSLNSNQPRLLSIDSDRIVPTPLHLYLGISNRIILEVFSELFGKELVEDTLKSVTTIHSAGCGGKSDVFQLNGPEVRKFLKLNCAEQLRAAVSSQAAMTPARAASFSVLKRWLSNLHTHLLHKRVWTVKEIEEWRAAVDDIQRNWRSETAQEPFPKLHMLRHSLEFAERYRFLGRVSEAQIESYHAMYNRLYHQHHLNKAKDTPERIRRALSDTSLRAIAPVLSEDKENVQPHQPQAIKRTRSFS